MQVHILHTNEPAVTMYVYGPPDTPSQIVFVHELAGWLVKAVMVPTLRRDLYSVDVVVRSLTTQPQPRLLRHLARLEPAAREPLLAEIASMQQRTLAQILLALRARSDVIIHERTATEHDDAEEADAAYDGA